MFFNKTKGIFDKASLAREEFQKAERLAKLFYLREAVKIAQVIVADWSTDPSCGGQLARQLALGDFLEQVKEQLQKWGKFIAEADRLAARARALLAEDGGNPLNIEKLRDALKFYKQCIRLLHDDNFIREAAECQQELEKRQQFQTLVSRADEQAEKRYFKLAYSSYVEAKALFSTSAVERALASVSIESDRETAYEAALARAARSSESGRLRSARALLKSALDNFTRADGIEFLEQLQRTIKGKELFRAGLVAEKAGELKVALNKYREAATLLADPTECQVRQAMLEVKSKEWARAISLLEGISEPQAAYIRGFAYAQQGNLQQAELEWQSLAGANVKQQSDILKIIAERQRLLARIEISQLVEEQKLEEALSASEAFIQKFGEDVLVRGNLNEHIQPRRDAAAWQSQDWEKIAAAAEQVWIEQQDVKSLHNWAVASYYRAQADSGQLSEAIVACSTALANISINPALKDIPWLGNNSIDLGEVARDLGQLVEEAIEAIKDKDILEYLGLRDRYRLEVAAQRQMGNPPTFGMRVKGLFITPGCYDRYRTRLTAPEFPAQLWGALYTDWGLAVAACLDGDSARAIQIKPARAGASSAERFASTFVSYHEGCHYLQQQRWRDAVNSLKQAQAEIRASLAWREQVDTLCGVQRQAITDFNEHLDFAKFWYDLLESQAARSYFAEYKAQQIREKLVAEQITDEKAIRELEEIKRLDPQNPVVLDLIERVEIAKEIKEIDRLLKNRDLDEMVRQASRSRHEQVRYVAAEFFIDILLEAVNSGKVYDFDEIRQLGRWAYQICPDAPQFQEIYRSLGLRY